VRNGRANAASGRIMVTVPNDHFGPILPMHDPSNNKVEFPNLLAETSCNIIKGCDVSRMQLMAIVLAEMWVAAGGFLRH
jgi:hypothetical protein